MENKLQHWGILGMKWGVRRFQKKDGTLTPAGKKRKENASSMSDEELTSKIKRMTLESTYNKLKPNTSKLDKTKKLVDATSSLVNQTKNMARETKKTRSKMDLSKMTDQELRERINRTNLERQYNDLFGSEVNVSKGRRYVTDILDVTGTTLVVGSSALGIALAIKELRK